MEENKIQERTRPRSLYPINFYVNYLGKPLYKTARKIGFSKTGSLAAANIPGSLAHVAGSLIGGDPVLALCAFVASEILYTGLFFYDHKKNQQERKTKLESKLENGPQNNLDALATKNPTISSGLLAPNLSYD